MGFFQKIKAQTHLFNVISQADCNVLAFYALLKQKGRKKPQTYMKKKKRRRMKIRFSSDFDFYFFLFFLQLSVSLMVFFWGGTLQSNSE